MFKNNATTVLWAVLLTLASVCGAQNAWALAANADVVRDLDEDFSNQTTDLDDHFSSVSGELEFDYVGTTGDTVGNLIQFDDESGEVEIEAIPNASGTQTFIFEGEDDSSDTPQWRLTLDVAAVNDAPTIASTLADIPVTEDAADSTVSLAGAFSDVDLGDTLSYSISVSGDPVLTDSLAGTDLTLEYLPDAHGVASVTVRATDDGGEFEEQTFAVTVSPVNDSPLAVGTIADVSVAEDASPESVDVSGIFTDVDVATAGDVLTYTAAESGDPVFAAVSVVGSIVELEFAPDANGSATVTVRATDTQGSFDEASFDVNVSAVNDPPTVVGAVPSGSFAEDTSLGVVDMSGVFDDVDLSREGDNLVLEVSGVADPGYIAGAAMNGSNLELSFQPDQLGTGASGRSESDGIGGC